MALVQELLNDLEGLKTKVAGLEGSAEQAIVEAVIAALESQGYTVTRPATPSTTLPTEPQA